MSQNILREPYMLFLISISFFGLFLVALFIFYQPTVQGESFLWRKPVIGSIFGSICALGILAVFFPSKCLSVFNLRRREKRTHYSTDKPDSRQSKHVSQKGSFTMQGHHPNCGNFSTHVFRINNRTFCTSCAGLLLGALISLVGTALYFFDSWHIGQESLLLVGAGILGIVFGLLQFPLFKNRPNFLRFFFNVFFVLGAFFILIGVDALLHSVTADLILVLLIVFWLLTRISLSQWDHERICRACGLMCDFVGQGFGSASRAGEDAN